MEDPARGAARLVPGHPRTHLLGFELLELDPQQRREGHRSLCALGQLLVHDEPILAEVDVRIRSLAVEVGPDPLGSRLEPLRSSSLRSVVESRRRVLTQTHQPGRMLRNGDSARQRRRAPPDRPRPGSVDREADRPGVHPRSQRHRSLAQQGSRRPVRRPAREAREPRGRTGGRRSRPTGVRGEDARNDRSDRRDDGLCARPTAVRSASTSARPSSSTTALSWASSAWPTRRPPRRAGCRSRWT